MNYIVFDLEFNQALNTTNENKKLITPKCPFEIIQIGAVMLDENLQIIGNLDRLVKPEIYLSINPFVKEITGITIELLNIAKTFKEVYEEFIELIEHGTCILCVWGMADIKELFRNIEYHKLDSSLIPREYINLQHYTSKYLNCSKGTNIGLLNAVKSLNIPIQNQFHDAFNDAYYTAKVFKKIYNENIKINVYNPYKNLKWNKNNSMEKKVDTYKLIRQFEKMFNREMTTEEQSIIKLAYIMGKTNQFRTEDSNKS